MALISDSVFDASALGFPSAVGTQSGKNFQIGCH